MEHFERTYRRRFYAIVGAATCALGVIAWLSVEGRLTPRGLVWAGLGYWVGGGVALYFVARARRRSAREARTRKSEIGVPQVLLDRERDLKTVKSMGILMGVFGGLLIVGFVETIGDPMLPRAASAGFDIVMLALCAFTRERAKRRLVVADSERRPAGTESN